MQDFQKRVVEEKKDLDGKIDSLRKFLLDTDGEVKSVALDERQRMNQQLAAMIHYADLLGDRINAFPPEDRPAPAVETLASIAPGSTGEPAMAPAPFPSAAPASGTQRDERGDKPPEGAAPNFGGGM